MRSIQIPALDSLDPRPHDGKDESKSAAQGVYLWDRSRCASAYAHISLLPQEENYRGGYRPENCDADERSIGELRGDQGVEDTREGAGVREHPSAEDRYWWVARPEVDDYNEDRREENAGGVHVVTDNVFPNVPRVVVGCFHGWYLRGTVCHPDLLDGMLEHRAHGVSRRTEYEEYG